MNVLAYFLYPLLWFGLDMVEPRNKDDETQNIQKRHRNYLSAINSWMSILFGLIYCYTGFEWSYEFVWQCSTGYFIWDTYMMILLSIRGSGLFIYHHMVSLMFLHWMGLGTNYETEGMLTYIVGELSNLPYYYVYELIHQESVEKENHSTKIIRWKTIQTIWFSFWRCIVMSYSIPTMWNVVDNSLLRIHALILHGMGMYWSYVLMVKLVLRPNFRTTMWDTIDYIRNILL